MAGLSELLRHNDRISYILDKTGTLILLDANTIGQSETRAINSIQRVLRKLQDTNIPSITKLTAQKQYVFVDELEEIARTESQTDTDSSSKLRPDEAYPRQRIVRSIEKRNSIGEASGTMIVRMPWETEERISTKDVFDKPDISAQIYTTFAIRRAHVGLKFISHLDIFVLR